MQGKDFVFIPLTSWDLAQWLCVLRKDHIYLGNPPLGQTAWVHNASSIANQSEILGKY